AMEERDDHLASRFDKSVDAVHRLAGLCQIIEFASDMVKAFVQKHGGFEDESISNEFLTKCVGERNTAPIILNTNANDTNTNDTNTNDTSVNDTSSNGTSRNNTSSNNTSSNDTSRNDTSSNDTSANENFSCNRDHDMPLNNYTLNNDVNENFLQNEDSTVSAVENNDNHVEVDEQMFITSELMTVDEFISITNRSYISMMGEYFPRLTLGGLNEYIKGKKGYCAILQVLGKYCVKRDIMISDEDASIMLTLWEKQAEAFGNAIRSIIGIKGAKICDFYGKSKVMIITNCAE
ncbi:unnamed protein product, partial [Rotaria sordida]